MSKCLRTLEAAAAVLLQVRDRLLDGGAGQDDLGDLLLLAAHPRELLESPLVGLVEVDGGAEEVTGGERVDLPADRVAIGRPGRELALEEVRELAVRGRRRRGAGLEVATQRIRHGDAVDGGPAHEREEEPVSRGMAAGLESHLAHLAQGGHDALLHSATQARGVALERLRDVAQPQPDVLPRRVGAGRHEVEDLPDVLGGRRDDVQVAQREPRLVLLRGEVELPQEVGARHAVDVVDRRGLAQPRRDPLARVDDPLPPLGRVVAVRALVPGAAEPDPPLGRELDEGVHPAVGDAVDLGAGPGFVHSPSLLGALTPLTASFPGPISPFRWSPACGIVDA
jgi:hypothetical protein